MTWGQTKILAELLTSTMEARRQSKHNEIIGAEVLQCRLLINRHHHALAEDNGTKTRQTGLGKLCHYYWRYFWLSKAKYCALP